MIEALGNFVNSMAFNGLTLGNIVMIAIAFILLYYAVAKHAEPLLLIPIAFGMILANIPPEYTGILNEPTSNQPGGLLWYIQRGLFTGVYPPLIFLGIGALTDFSFLISNPLTIFLGGGAQVGILVAFLTSHYLGFDLKISAAIGIIGGADGPTSIYVATKFAPQLLGIIAVAAYSYISLIPIIQPPIMKLLTTKTERKIRMPKPREVSKLEKLVFPLVVVLIIGFFVPKALPLVGMLMLGNFLRECGVAKRLVEASSRYILDSVTILLSLSVGSTARADVFLTADGLKVILLGIVAFASATAAGILLAKFFNLFLKKKINPLIGAAGVSAVPDSSRVAQKVAQEEDPGNFILMHAMGPNVAGVIGSAIVAGVFLSMIK
ncbi:MAG: carboxybiotin decarboxylase [Thermotogaceae bacterium]|nr:carboxybiotin decarboxylase [Thermotogaceae bacterium]MDN5338044.1 carboxybiotin decarboxylase [Thermotogaceae bacterium]